MAAWPVLLLVIFQIVSTSQVPRLKLLPETVQRSIGDKVYVSCKADVPNPSLISDLQWHGPNGREIPHPDGLVTTLEGTEEMSLGLFIQNLREEDTGVYNCTAAYSGNQQLNAGIVIESHKSIDFKDTDLYQTPKIGTEAKIRCVVEASPSPIVDWVKDGKTLQTDENHIIQADGIFIKNVSLDDEGVYRCRARVAELGQIDYREIKVEVLEPPVITQGPQHTSGVEKESVTFQCVAKGKPPPTYSWVDRNSRVLDELEGYFVDKVSGELRIMDLKPEHAGNYRCTAKNPAGELTADAVLHVLTKPKIEEFKNITLRVDDTAELVCILSGDPLPHAHFKKESNNVPFVDGVNDDNRIEVVQEEDSGRRVGILKIIGLMRSDDGLYSCKGLSDGGESEGWGHITVEFAPIFEPQQTNFSSFENQRVNVSCLATSIPNATVDWFRRNEPIRLDDPNYTLLSRGPLGILQVNPIDTSYFDTYTCRATNTIGSADQDVRLNQIRKPGPVSSAQVEKKTATTISWNVRDPLDNGGSEIQGYTVQYRLQGQSWSDALSRYWTKGSSFILDELKPLHTYVFRFAARNEAGDGEWSGEKSESMPEISVPEEPLIYSVKPDEVKKIPYSDHYNLQWQVPPDNGERIDHFQIVYYQVKNASKNVWQAMGDRKAQIVEYPGASNYEIDGLASNAYHKIELRAHNKLGYSTPAEAVIQTAYATESGVIKEGSILNIGQIIGILILIVLVLLFVLDISCFFAKNVGITARLVSKTGSKGKEKDKEAMLEDTTNVSGDNLKEALKNEDNLAVDNHAKNTDSDSKTPVISDEVNKPEGNGKMKESDKNEALHQEQKELQEVSETTPMLPGEGMDKDTILEDEHQAEKAKKEETSAITKDSPV